MDKQQIRETIEMYELNHSGLRKINGGYTIASNIRIRKNKVIANIELGEQDMGSGHSRSENITDCEYPMSLFKEVKE